MVSPRQSVRILVIRAWTKPLGPLRALLRAAGIEARIWRVDIEPALNAELTRSNFDLILFDPTGTISREVVEQRLREHRRVVPVVESTGDDSDAVTIARALTWRLN
jgi:hypothetical protein